MGVGMKKTLYLLALAFLLLLSGCVTTGNSSTNGIIITSFVTDPSEVESGEEVYFVLDIQNVGGAKATDIKAKLIGLPDDWGTPETKTLGELLPPGTGTEGEEYTFEWLLKAPEMYTTITYPVEAWVEYHYTTHYEALVRIATRDWIKTLPPSQQEEEKKRLGVVEASPQLGPIHVDFKIRSGLVHEDVNRGVTIVLQNVGSGRPLNDEVRVTIKSDRLNCPDAGLVTLSKGQTKQIRCSVNLGGIEQWKNIKIAVDLDYDYWVRSSTDVTVLGRPIE